MADRSVSLPMTWSNLERRYVRRQFFFQADLDDCVCMVSHGVTGRSMYLEASQVPHHKGSHILRVDHVPQTKSVVHYSSRLVQIHGTRDLELIKLGEAIFYPSCPSTLGTMCQKATFLSSHYARSPFDVEECCLQ